MRRAGYDIHLIFLWLSSPDLAVARVADRVKSGGHNVPEPDIRRRYAAGLANFFTLYQPLVTTWRMYNNSNPQRRRLIAWSEGGAMLKVSDKRAWRTLVAEYSHEE